jgi:uncharacterized protein (TIGR02246 family)
MIRTAMLGLCLLLGTAASASAQTTAAIQALNDKWDAAFNKGDAAAIAAMYAPDATVLPPGGDMIKGRDGIQKFWGGAVQQLGDAKLTTVDVLPLGSAAAREIGTFSFKTKGATPQDMTGKYVVVWRRIGGKWLLATDIWNANK